MKTGSCQESMSPLPQFPLLVPLQERAHARCHRRFGTFFDGVSALPLLKTFVVQKYRESRGIQFTLPLVFSKPALLHRLPSAVDSWYVLLEHSWHCFSLFFPFLILSNYSECINAMAPLALNHLICPVYLPSMTCSHRSQQVDHVVHLRLLSPNRAQRTYSLTCR